MPPSLLYGCFFGSGAGSLILEIVWSKYLSYLLGNSVFGVATVVAAFLGGLGAGAAIGGRLAARTDSPLKVYGRLEAAVGILAFLSPLALLAARPLFASLYAALSESPGPFFLVRFLILFAALFVPTMAMGATLPLVVAELARRGSAAQDSIVGRLYAVNTAGGVAGVTAAGFFLIPTLGLWKSAALAGLIDLTVAALVLTRRPAPVPATPPEPAAPTGGSRPRGALVPAPLLALALSAISGFTAILYQVAWTRVLIVPFGGMVYAFSAILATYLAGIALGAVGAARLLRRTAAVWVALGLLELAMAGAVVSGAHLFDDLPHLIASVIGSSSGSPTRLYAGEIGITALIVFVPTLVMGALFPVLTAAYRQRRLAAGSAVGAIYAANTVGAIAGSLATAFMLIPMIGALGAILLAAAINAAIGVGALYFGEGRARWRRPAALAAAAATVLVAVAAPPRMTEDRATLGFVRLIRSIEMGGETLTHQVIDHVKPGSPYQQVLFYRQGRVANVSVIRSGGTLSLLVNGKTDATLEGRIDMLTQVLLGQLPLLLARDPKDVCIIGYGSGGTTRAVLSHPIREAVTVEIEPAVVEAGAQFRQFVGEPLADPRSRLLIEDAGTYLRSTRRRFDVIVSEPSNLWIAGMADLFTRDFYRAASARLRPGGVFCQWVQCYQTSPATVNTVLRTFASVFPRGQAFYIDGIQDLILVASPDRDLPLDLEGAATRMSPPGVARDLAGVGIESVADLLRYYRGRVGSYVRSAGPGPVNTDDNAYLEHRAPFDLLEGDTSARLFDWPPFAVSDLASELSHAPGAAALLTYAMERATAVRNEPAARGLGAARALLASSGPAAPAP